MYVKQAVLTDGTQVTVELLHYPDDYEKAFCRACAFVTIGKDSDAVPTDTWLHSICKAGHSPIRELKFAFRFDNLPYFVSTHLVRHVHAQPYVKSQRNDRQHKYDRRKAPQDAPVCMIWTMNAEELMTVCHKRLCNMADPDTQMIVRAMAAMVNEAVPYLNGLLVPMCEYLGGRCNEMKPCGKYTRNEM